MLEPEPLLQEDHGKKDFYISYASPDSHWAQWVAFYLQGQGYSFILPEWDFRPGTNIILEIHKAVSQCERTIALLSPQYVTAMYTSPDWTVAFQQGETNDQPRLLPLRIQQCEIEGLLKPYQIIDLVDLTEDAAREKLMSTLKISSPKLKQPPRFPGLAATVIGPFPDRNPLFLGREEILKSLYRFLHAGHTIVALTPLVSVEKERSIGKTAIVVEYVYRNQCEYEAVLWLSQNPEDPSPALLLENINQVVEKLDGTISQKKETYRPLQILKQWLENHTNWLLILDGITTIHDVQDLFLYRKNGHIIITTRERSIASVAHLIELEDRLPEEKILSQKIHHLVNAALHSPNGEHFPLSIGQITIGSAPENQICLNDPSVAPYHAIIQLHEGSYELIDLHSPFGTFLNRQRLTPHQAYPLQPADAIQIGQRWLAYGSDVTRLVFPSPSQPGNDISSLLPEPKPSEYAHMVADEQQKSNASTVHTRPAIRDVHYYLEAAKQENIPPTWLVRQGNQLPPLHLSNEDVQDIAITTKIFTAFLLSTLVSLILILAISNDIMPFLLCIFTLDIALTLYFAAFMMTYIKKPPHPTLVSLPQALFILVPEGFIEYLNEQEIICVSFHELGGTGIEYDEDGMPWLELSYLDGTTLFWSQHAYFGQPEFIVEKLFHAFLEYARKYYTLPIS